MSYKLTPVALLVMALYAVGVRADDADAQMFSFSGFGTLGVVHSSENKADFTSSIFKPQGAGYSHRWSADVDSLIAGQVTANLTPRLSAVLQVISEQNSDNSYRPHVEWANIKYQFTPDFSVRVGRIVLPAFLLSDTRKVGYATAWVRPPVEVYQLLPVTSNDGVDASYRLHFGEFTNTVQGSIGNNDTKLTNNGGYSKARDSWGISNTTEYGPLTVHIAYLKTNLTVESINPLFNAFRQFGPEGIAIADKYDPANKPFPFLGLGASYDPGNWFVMGEWGHAKRNSVLGDNTAWYASGGYRFEKFTPYLIYADAKVDSNTSDPGLTVSALPPFLAGPATGLNAALNAILGSATVQNTISIGGRWDFMKNAAFKLQFDHTRIGAGSPGVLSNTQPGFQPGGKVNVFSATVDFVF
jgi:hypothetical protein